MNKRTKKTTNLMISYDMVTNQSKKKVYLKNEFKGSW